VLKTARFHGYRWTLVETKLTSSFTTHLQGGHETICSLNESNVAELHTQK